MKWGASRTPVAACCGIFRYGCCNRRTIRARIVPERWSGLRDAPGIPMPAGRADRRRGGLCDADAQRPPGAARRVSMPCRFGSRAGVDRSRPGQSRRDEPHGRTRVRSARPGTLTARDLAPAVRTRWQRNPSGDVPAAQSVIRTHRQSNRSVRRQAASTRSELTCASASTNTSRCASVHPAAQSRRLDRTIGPTTAAPVQNRRTGDQRRIHS